MREVHTHALAALFDAPWGRSLAAMRVNFPHARLRNSQFLKWFAEKECSRTLRRRRRMPVLGEPGITDKGDKTVYAEGWVIAAGIEKFISLVDASLHLL